MLEKLSEVDWNNVQGAFGPAKSIPDLLRQLASDDRKAASNAYLDLSEHINHQGSTFYPASVPTIPFLIELLTVESVQVKADILILLRRFAPSRYWNEGELSLWPEPERPAAYAVLAGMPVYIDLLEHSEPWVRSHAFELLCCPSLYSPDKIPLITGALNRQFENEMEPISKLFMTVCFGKYLEAYKHFLSGDQIHEFGKVFETLWRSAENKDLSFAASVSLAKVVGEEAPDDIVEGFVEVLAKPMLNPQSGMPVWIAPGLHSGIDTEAELALWHLGFQRSIPAFARALQQVSDPKRARELATALLSWVMAGRRFGGYLGKRKEKKLGRVVYVYRSGAYRWAVKSLTEVEQQALDAVLRADKVWEEPNNLLEMYGLPADRKVVRRLFFRKSNESSRFLRFRLRK